MLCRFNCSLMSSSIVPGVLGVLCCRAGAHCFVPAVEMSMLLFIALLLCRRVCLACCCASLTLYFSFALCLSMYVALKLDLSLFFEGVLCHVI